MGEISGYNFDIKKFSNPNDIFTRLDREVLVDNLTTVARDGFGSDMQREDVEKHVLSGDILYLIREKSNLIGFSSFDLIDFKKNLILYLRGIVIMRNYQKQGLFYEINEKAISSGDYNFLAMRTQNPVIYAATNRVVRELYPNGQNIPEDVGDVGRFIAKNYLGMGDFCDRTFIGRKTYGTSLYDFIPKHKRADKFFESDLKLNYESGDSVILVGRLK